MFFSLLHFPKWWDFSLHIPHRPRKRYGLCGLHVSSPCLAGAGEAQFANWLKGLLLSSPPNVLQSLTTLLLVANCQKIAESQSLKITQANCLMIGDKWISLAEVARAAIMRWEQAGPAATKVPGNFTGIRENLGPVGSRWRPGYAWEVSHRARGAL